jgi:hypothetical protein
MILALMKRDLAWKIGLGQAALAIVLTSMDWGDPNPQWTRLLNVQALLIVSGFFCSHRRATAFEAALPIEGRQLFLARVLPRMAMVWLPVLAAIIVMLPGRDAGWPQVLEMLQCGAIYSVAYLLPLSVRVRECAPPAGLLAALWTGLAAAGAVAWRFLSPGVFLSVFALAGAAILLRTWVAVPAGFQVAPMKAVDSIASRRSIRGAPLFAWWPIVRSAGFGMPLFTLPMGVLLGWSGEMFLPSAAMFAVFANIEVRQRTRWLYALPLSFRALGLITLVPSLALLLGGFAIGSWADKTPPWDNSLVAGPRSQSRTDVNMDVAFEFWRRAPDGRAPVISAPWGETARATTFRVLGVTYYNPYSVDARNSRRFIEWQFERATDAVYGRVIPLLQYGEAFRAGLTPVTARPRMRILILSADFLAILMLVYLTEWTRWHRLRRPAGPLREALPFVLLLVVLTADGVVRWFYSFPLEAAVVRAALLHVSNLLPNNLLVVTAAAIVPVMGMYWLVEKQFSKAELVGPIQSSSAWDRRMQAE